MPNPLNRIHAGAVLAGVALAVFGSPTQAEVFELWDSKIAFPSTEQIPELSEVEHVRVHTGASEFSFLLGAAIVEHKGTLLVGWGNSVRDENDDGSVMAGRRSLDEGRTWGDFEILAPNPEGPDSYSHGVFLSHEGTLQVFVPRAGYEAGKGYPNLRTERFVLDENEGRWESQGEAIGGEFWPMQEPQRMGDGNFLMAGLVCGRTQGGADAAVAISHGEDFSRWDRIVLPSPGGQKSWGETTVFIDGNEVVAVARNRGKKVALVSRSEDYGRTWTELRDSNFVMSPSKPLGGTLENGQRYLLSNTPGESYRDTLTIAMTRPGEKKFCFIRKIRSGLSPAPRFEGRGHKTQWAYPYAIEHNGALYVVYASTKENCELSIIPLKALEVE